MATAKKTTETNNEPEADETPARRRVAIPKPKGSAQVRTTISYPADINDDENENNNARSALPESDRNGFPLASGFAPYSPHNPRTPQNQLATMFADLREIADSEDETFYALITRRQDLMNDSFRVRCDVAQNFPPFQVTPRSMLSFIPTIQKYNGNSGGRFDIVITDEYGEPQDISIRNFTVPNPMLEEKPSAGAQADVNGQMLEMFDRLMQRNDEKIERLIQSMRPEKDRLAMLMEKKIEQEILNPQPASGFNTDEFIAKIFGAQTMIDTLSSKFAEKMDGGKAPDKEQSTFEKLLSNEMIVNKAVELVGNIAQVAEHIAMQKTQTQQPQPQPQANPAQPNNAGYTGYPPLPPEPETTEQTMREQQLINDIIAELESDRPLDDNNEFIQRLKVEYAEFYPQLQQLCKLLTFEQLYEQLEAAAPTVFEPFYTNDEQNERGEKLENRLRDFYYYIVPEKKPAPEPETDATESETASA